MLFLARACSSSSSDTSAVSTNGEGTAGFVEVDGAVDASLGCRDTGNLPLPLLPPIVTGLALTKPLDPDEGELVLDT